MALNPQYIVAINLQEVLVDKDTGLPLSNGYIEFFQDTSRTTPKTVYQITGSPPDYTYSALSNPITLSSIGVPVNADGDQVHIYYYPYDADGEIQLYYIAVYNEDGVLQYTLEAWPNITAEDNPADQNNNVSNQISNAQFSQVNFVVDQGLVISFDDALEAAVYQIAPDWEIIITSSGSGSLTIEQVALEGSLSIETNPPYKLTFSPSGVTITNLILRQVFNHNPDIWSATSDGGGYISGIMLIESLDGQAHTLEMQYVQSGGPSSPQTIVIGSTLTSGYQLLNETVLLNAGTNTDDADAGAIYIDIVLPNTGFYSITSIQVVGLNDDNAIVNFEQESINRQLDHLFHYYKSGLDFKPIKSYLCGWYFPLNPAQFNGSTVSASAEVSQYLWDQTIGWQSVVSSLSASRYSAGGSATNSLQLSISNDCQIAIIQYLTVPQIIDLLSNDLSSNIILSNNQGSISGTISLFYTIDETVPNINTDGESLIATVNANGKPLTFNGTWVEIDRSNYGDAIFTTSSSVDLNDLQSFGFNGWKLDSDFDINTITYFAIVVGFEELESGNYIVVQSCSLVPGTVPTIPEKQTYDEVLSECRYYYEMTYIPGTIPETASILGAKMTPAGIYNPSAVFQAYPYIFSDYFIETKVTAPILTYYSVVTGSSNEITFYSNTSSGSVDAIFSDIFIINGSITVQNANWGVTNNDSRISISGLGAEKSSCVMTYQRTADSRIGVY